MGKKLKNICGMVLVGGKATRLASVGLAVPKPMILLGGKPLVSWIADWLLRVVPAVYLLTGPESQCFKSHFSKPPVSVIECPGVGTGADLLWASQLVREEELVVCNGDTVLAAPLNEVIQVHRKRLYGATVLLTRRTDAQNPFAFAVDSKGRVLRSFEDGEPGTSPYVGAKWHGASTGLFVFSRLSLNDSTHMEVCSLERELVPELIKAEELFAYDNSTRYCLDIGTPDRLQKLNTESSEAMNAFAWNAQ